MLSFLKKFFGAKAAVSPCPEAPYKVEAASQFPFPKAQQEAKPAKKPAAKKPAAKKPRKEKAPK